MSNFKKGDVVRLKSGGLQMTVEDIYHEDNSSDNSDVIFVDYLTEGTVCVVYFDKNNQLVRAQFEPELLILAENSYGI